MTSKLTREQATDSELQMLIDSHEKGTAMFLRVDAYYLMAKELQERRKADSEPVATLDVQSRRPDGNKFALVFSSAAHKLPDDVYFLYRHAQPAPVVPDDRYQHLGELYHAQEKRLFKLAQRINGPSFDKYAYSPSQAIDVLETAIFGEKEDNGSDCRAAMLQGQPVSNRDELPLDYLQGHKDGLEWSAQLAEANYPHTGDWLYDDPIELAKAIRKGPDMPEAAGNSPVIPDGYALVPIIPTEDMVINGFESEPDPHFSDEKEWAEYEALSGCRQAARRAELCWAAMIKAAPKLEGKNG